MIQTPVFAVVAGVVTGAVTAATSLIESQHVGLGTACGVGMTVCGGVWWLSRTLQRIDDRLDGGEKRFGSMDEKLDNLKTQIESLDCHRNGCPETKPKKPHKE